MPTSYNQITGQSLERLAALSDGIFAVAMTLLVLDLHVPAREVIHSQGELWHTLAGAAPQLISYMMSFMTLGIFWNGQQAQLNSFSRSDRHLSWIHIAFLFAGVDHALLHSIAGGIYLLPQCPHRLLGQYSAARRGAVRQLALCHASGSAAGRDYP